MKEIKWKTGNIIDDHPWIASIIGAITGLILFILWPNSISEIASAMVIFLPLLVIYLKCMFTS